MLRSVGFSMGSVYRPSPINESGELGSSLRHAASYRVMQTTVVRMRTLTDEIEDSCSSQSNRKRGNQKHMGRASLSDTATTAQSYISKSKFLAGLQRQRPDPRVHCRHASDLQPGPRGRRTRQADVPRRGRDRRRHLRLRRNAPAHPEGTQTPQTLFEAAFAANGGFCRVDILQPAPRDAWDIIEVKSTTSLTSLKDVYLEDLGFQV